MQSAWNSCPQGRLITRLSPSTYSSRQTTHSIWRPVYRFLHTGVLVVVFSLAGDDAVDGPSLLGSTVAMTPEVVWDRGRLRHGMVLEADRRSGDVGDEFAGVLT
jgi:hypothetical protein